MQPPAFTPYTIAIDDAVLTDLHDRLARTRWPSEPQSGPWRYGTDLAWMQGVAEHWRTTYDWRAWEARLNALPNHRTELDGLPIHFILEQGSGPDPLPLLLTHGWPGSVVEFLDVIGPLAHPERHGGDPADSFTVVAPSLPGYGFSAAPKSPLSLQQIARMWSSLMRDTLGFRSYVAQGGDWGGIITATMGLHVPEGIRAMHLNIVGLEPAPDPANPLSPTEQAWRDRNAERGHDLSGYRTQQSTRPQTLAYGLTDSPAGLAAWILEKFHDWTIRGQDAPPPFELDRLLTNVMLYWLGDANAASWLYTARATPETRTVPAGRRIEVPTGFSLCPADLGEPPPTEFLRRGYNVVSRNDPPTGGHFLALEQPDFFVQEVRRFFRPYRG